MRDHGFYWKLFLAVAISGAVGALLGGLVRDACAAPLTVHVHKDSLYGETRAEVRVYTTIKAKKPTTATITIDALDTSNGNWGTLSVPTIAHARLHKGINRIHRTLTAEYLDPRYCAYRAEFAQDHPECPRLKGFHDPYLSVPIPFDRVWVRVWTGDGPAVRSEIRRTK